VVGFVMVPVPEEHVLEVMAYVTRLAEQPAPAGAAPAQQWDQERVDRLVAESNDRTRALLGFIAHRSRAGKEVAPREIAAGLGFERSDIPGILGPLNRQFRRDHLAPLFESRVRTVTNAEGRPEKRRTIVLPKDSARMVRTALAAAARTPVGAST
jgi:hypothetical protein